MCALCLTTARLILRPPLSEDAGAIYTALCNFEISKNLARVPHPYPKNAAQEWIERQKNIHSPCAQHMCIFDQTARFLGMAGFSLRQSEVHLAYYLTQESWGKGYMSEACFALLEWFFHITDEEKIISGYFAYNTGSKRVQDKLGFKQTGQGMVHSLAQNKDIAHIDTCLTRHDFEHISLAR